jgi:hypothetical protein
MTGITTLAQLKSLFTLTRNARYFGSCLARPRACVPHALTTHPTGTVVPEAGLALLDRLLASWPASSAFPRTFLQILHACAVDG